MKKKISLVLSMLFLICMLGACGADPTTVDYNGRSYDDLKNEIITNAFYVSYIAEMSEEEKLGLAQYGIPDTMVDASSKWSAVADEFGACEVFATVDETQPLDPSMFDMDSFTVTKSGETLTTDVTLQFGKKDVVFQTVYDYFSMDVTGYTIEPIYTLGEKMSKAGMNTLISISIVFCVLILISLIIYAFNIFPYMEKKKKEKAAQNQPAVPVVEPVAPVQPVAAPQVVDETDDAELIAVIAAAIAASEGTSTSGFVVRSINRR